MSARLRALTWSILGGPLVYIFFAVVQHSSCEQIQVATLGREIKVCSLYNARKDQVLRPLRRLDHHAPGLEIAYPGNEILEATVLESLRIPTVVLQQHLGMSDSLFLSHLAGLLKGYSGQGLLLNHHKAHPLTGKSNERTLVITVGSREVYNVTDEQCTHEIGLNASNRAATHVVVGLIYAVRSTYVCEITDQTDNASLSWLTNKTDVETLVSTSYVKANLENTSCIYYGDKDDPIQYEIHNLFDLLSYLADDAKPTSKAHTITAILSPLEDVTDLVDVPHNITKSVNELRHLLDAADNFREFQYSTSDLGLASVQEAITQFASRLPKLLDMLWSDLILDVLHNGLPDLRTNFSDRMTKDWSSHYTKKITNVLKVSAEVVRTSFRLAELHMKITQSTVLSSLYKELNQVNGVAEIDLLGTPNYLNTIIVKGKLPNAKTPKKASFGSNNTWLILTLHLHDHGLMATMLCLRDYQKMSSCLGNLGHVEDMPEVGTQFGKVVTRFLNYADEYNSCRLETKQPNLKRAVYIQANPTTANASWSVAQLDMWRFGRKDKQFNAEVVPCIKFIRVQEVMLTRKFENGKLKLKFAWRLPPSFANYGVRITLKQYDASSRNWGNVTETTAANATVDQHDMDTYAARQNAYLVSLEINFVKDDLNPSNKSEPEKFHCPRLAHYDKAVNCKRVTVLDAKPLVCEGAPECFNCYNTSSALKSATEISTENPDEQVIFISATRIATYTEANTNGTACFAFYENCNSIVLRLSAPSFKFSPEQLENAYGVLWNATFCNYWNTEVLVETDWTVCLHCRGLSQPIVTCFNIYLQNQTKVFQLNDDVKTSIQDTLDKNDAFAKNVLQTDATKNYSYCYFSSNNPANEGNMVYINCIHCVETFLKGHAPNSKPVGISCEKGKFEAFNSSTWDLDEQRTLSVNSDDAKDQDLVEPLLNGASGFVLRGVAGSKIQDGKANQRPQRVLYGRLLAVQASGDLLLSLERFATSMFVGNLKGEWQWRTGKPWAISCRMPCKRSISLTSIDTAGLNESIHGQSKSAKHTLSTEYLEVSSDSLYEASERSIAIDELGNIIVAVMRMETATKPGCSTGLNCCVVTFKFEVYLYNPATGETQNVTRHFPYSFNEQRCSDELSGEFGYRQVHGHHALFVNRGYIYLRLGNLAKYQKLFKLKYMDELAAASTV